MAGASDNFIAQAISALTQVFQQSFPRITGSVTLGAAATTVVPNTSVAANSVIDLIPTNAAAATLVGSVKCPYVSARSPGVSFTIATANGAAAVGSEQFTFTLLNPV